MRGSGPIKSTRNPLIEYVEVKTGGETYHLAFDLDAIIEVNRETGLNLFAGIASGELSTENIRLMIYAALKSAHHDITQPQVNAILKDMPTYARMSNAMLQAYGLSTQDPPVAGEAERLPPAAVPARKPDQRSRQR
jgi:hypothetical protein